MKVDNLTTLSLQWVLVEVCLVKIIVRTGLAVLLRWDLGITLQRGGRFVSDCVVGKLSAFTLCSLTVTHQQWFLFAIFDCHLMSEVCQYWTWRTIFPVVEISIFKVCFSFGLYYLVSFRSVTYRKGWNTELFQSHELQIKWGGIIFQCQAISTI